MKKHQQVIKILILTLFVISMLYLTLKDDLQDILQLLQNLDFHHSLLLITVSFITCILGGVIIGMLGHKAQDDYRLYNGISNGLVSLFLMNVSASAFAKAAQMVMFKMKNLKQMLLALSWSWISCFIRYLIYYLLHSPSLSIMIFGESVYERNPLCLYRFSDWFYTAHSCIAAFLLALFAASSHTDIALVYEKAKSSCYDCFNRNKTRTVLQIFTSSEYFICTRSKTTIAHPSSKHITFNTTPFAAFLNRNCPAYRSQSI